MLFSLSARRPVTGTDVGKEPMKSYGKNNVWKNILSCSSYFNDLVRLCQAQILLGVLHLFKIPGHILPAIPKEGMRDAHSTGVPEGYGKGERKPYRIWNLEFPRKE